MILIASVILILYGILGLFIQSNNMINMLFCIQIIFIGIASCAVWVAYVKSLLDLHVFVLFIIIISLIVMLFGAACVIFLYRKHKKISLNSALGFKYQL